MASKTLTLLSFSILALLTLVTFASASTLATWALTSSGAGSVDASLSTKVTAGTFAASTAITSTTFSVANGAEGANWPIIASVDATKYYEVTISPVTGYTLTISDLSFNYSGSVVGPDSFVLQYSKNATFASPTTIVTKIDVSTGQLTSSNTGLSIKVDSGEKIYLRWFGYDFAAVTDKLYIKDLKISGVVVPVPVEITTCKTTGNTNNNLVLSIDDVSVTGYGEDYEWYPLDKITVDVNVENKNAYKIRNIGLKWGLYDRTAGEFVIDGDENDFTLDDGDDKTITVDFELDTPKDFKSGGDYVFYVWTDGAKEETTKSATTFEVCASASEEASVVISSSFVMLDNIQTAETVSCGSSIQVSAKVWNFGESDEDNVFVVVQNKDLGIDSKIELGTIDTFKSKDLLLDLDIPDNAESGKIYDLEFSVFNEDGELFQNENDDEAKFLLMIKPEAGCKNEPQASVTANLESASVEAGKEFVVKATIKNDASVKKTLKVSVEGISDWAELVSLDKDTLELDAGKSADILVTLKVNSGITGSQNFNLEVKEGEKVLSQPVQVSVQKPAFGFTGAFLGGDNTNWYIWGIGALNVILILVIIIVAVRVIKK